MPRSYSSLSSEIPLKAVSRHLTGVGEVGANLLIFALVITVTFKKVGRLTYEFKTITSKINSAG